MAHAYTPGLKVSESSFLKKERRLPMKGEVSVKKGDKVTSDTVVARTYLPGNVQLVNIAHKLGIEPSELRKFMIKNEGDAVNKDGVIAESKGLFGLFKTQSVSPVGGTIETISNITGQVIIREPAVPVEISAYIDGVADEVIEQEGVIVKTYGTFIQGIFGIGGETNGILEMISAVPSDIAEESKITLDLKGRIIVIGSLVTSNVIKAAVKFGVKGIIAGGIDDQDLRDFLGYDLGVAITGSEDKGITLVITEGFGKIKMAEKTFNLLKSRAGKKVSINGATQIRAGVIRPEVIVPETEQSWPSREKEEEDESMGMGIGSPIRIIREPKFGTLGKVTALPVELQTLETEAKVRVVEVELETGEKMVLPRANVELIEA